MKILAKMGISVISSYRGGYEFEALGLSRALVAEFFPGMPSRISGIGLAGIEAQTVRKAQRAASRRRAPGPPHRRLLHRIRAGRGDPRLRDAEMIHRLQDAYDTRRLRALQGLFPPRCASCRPSRCATCWTSARPTGRRRWTRSRASTRSASASSRPGMSLGALSPEAHETPQHRHEPHRRALGLGRGRRGSGALQAAPNGDNPNSAVKQVASGRFGVTAEYLNQCREIEIKVGPGRQARRGRPAARLQGHRVHRPHAPLDAGREPDQPAAAPRHLFDRGPGPAHLRPEADQPRRPGHGEAGLHPPASARSRRAWPRRRPTSS